MLSKLDSTDIAIASKAVALRPGLTGTARQIGAALLDHYNRDTGRCDPGIGRLAKLTGCGNRTVMDALDELEAVQLFARAVHGGNRHCNAYRPHMGTCREIVEDWQERMKSGAAPALNASKARKERRVLVSAFLAAKNGDMQRCENPHVGTCENPHVDSAEIRTQTYLKNLSNRTYRGELGSGGVENVATFTASSSPSAQASPSRQGLMKRGERPDTRRIISTIARASKPSRPRQAAEEQAQRRICDHFQKIGGAAFIRFCEVATPGDPAYDAAVTAEASKHGAGIQAMADRIGKIAA